MKVTLSPTGKIDTINGSPARLWEGEDDFGTPVKAWIATISPQTHDAAANQRFADALRELKPTPRSESFDIRFLVD